MDSASDSATGDTVYGNNKGIKLLQEREEFRREFVRISEELGHVKEKLKEHDHELELQQTLHAQQRRFSGCFLQIRQRHLDKRREASGLTLSPESRKSIVESNKIAHEADAVADAHLYLTRMRTDWEIFTDLYGISAKKVPLIDERKRPETITVLNKWSTRVVDEGRDNIPPKVVAAFEKFISILEKDLNADPLQVETELGQAYASFWKEWK
ncbi:hypothetical protein FQN54_004654 [Arachnomyces sp. PD_36]|nr:hypothetical protein FQN54_004654 [Arachnomyces sp. PD_36]